MSYTEVVKINPKNSMKILDIVKKVSKILFYLSLSFAAVFSAITYYGTAWIKTTSDGSKQVVECQILLNDYKKVNKLTDEDPKIVELKGFCDGISYRSFSYKVGQNF